MLVSGCHAPLVLCSEQLLHCIKKGMKVNVPGWGMGKRKVCAE